MQTLAPPERIQWYETSRGLRIVDEYESEQTAGLRVQTVDRSVAILKAINSTPSGLTLTQLCSILGLPKTSVYRVLQALLKHDLLRKDDLTKVYRLGPALLVLRTDALYQWDLFSIAAPHVRELAEAANETTILTRLYRDRIICLDSVESARSFRYFVTPGREIPLHCGASATAILAYLPGEQISRMLGPGPFARFTPRTITDLTELLEHLEQVRGQGYAFSDGELEVGIRAIAAPIMGNRLAAMGSVAIVAPAERLDAEARERLLPSLLDTAQRISERMGYRLEPPISETTRRAVRHGK
ncbi:MAG TPA: IclR family transcriptional regulator [Anaerolineae bacterium]|nr:IclR family transcriptional regulator [Anaerolineae bacterium]